jgi:small subunit ribosomal protein S6
MSKVSCYELCYILKPETGKEATEEIQQKILTLVKEKDGHIESVDEWPVRPLAFPIKKESKGKYTFVQIKSGHQALPPLKNYLSFCEDVLRFDVFNYGDHYDYHELKKLMHTRESSGPVRA